MEGVGCPTYIVYELVGFALPAEFCEGGTAREGGEPAAGIGVGGNFAESRFVPVAVKQVEHGGGTRALGVFDGYPPCVQTAAETAQNFNFGSVVTL